MRYNEKKPLTSKNLQIKTPLSEYLGLLAQFTTQV